MWNDSRSTICGVLTLITIVMFATLAWNKAYWSPNSSKCTGTPKKDAVLILFSDKPYLSCLVHLVTSTKSNGTWEDDMILISTDLSATDLGQLSSAFLEIRRPSKALMALGPRYQKLEFLRIQGYRRGIYLDADGIVLSSLHPLKVQPFPNDVWFLWRDNGLGVGKAGLFHYFKQASSIQDLWPGVINYPNVGSTSLFAVNFDALPSDAFARAVAIAYSCRHFVKVHDQSVLHIFAEGKWNVFADCIAANRMRLTSPSEEVEGYWSIDFCQNGTRFYGHDAAKHCLGGKGHVPDIHRPVSHNRGHSRSAYQA